MTVSKLLIYLAKKKRTNTIIPYNYLLYSIIQSKDIEDIWA